MQTSGGMGSALASSNTTMLRDVYV